MRSLFSSWLVFALAVLALAGLAPGRAAAYVEAAHSLGQVIELSSNIMVLQVEKVDKEKNMIIFRKVRDLKGKHPTDVVKHNIGRGGFHPREWQYPMEWAEPGKKAIFFHNGGASETCTGTYWYQAYAGGEWWNMSHGEPFLLRSFAGQVDKLAAAVTEVLAGKEVVVPCMVDGNKDDLHLRRARIQRLKVSLKLQQYDQKRDFVGWGGEDFRRIQGMPAFTHVGALGRSDPEAQAVSIADVDGDGKPDVCLVGGGRLLVLQNGGESMNEVSLPGFTGGCRAAVWADYNGDGRSDLFLATPAGPRLFANLPTGFRDDSALLPREESYNLTAAAWIDQDGDGKPDLLLGNGFHGLRLYRNKGRGGTPPPPGKPGDRPGPAPEPWFEDVSVKVGLGPNGIAGTLKGDALAVADVDGDGRPDFLYGAGTGVLVRNTPQGFVEVKDSGLSFKPGKVGVAFADFDGDGCLDLAVPQESGVRLFKGNGKGKFTDVTDKAGDLAKPLAGAASAAWGDLDNDGKPDLVVGCLRGPNRFFRNKGDGTFEEATAAVGLHTRILNSQAVALADLNGDGALDLVCNNEGQDPCVFLGNPEFAPAKGLITVRLAGADGVIGSQVRLTDKEGKLLAWQAISGGEGRGGQPVPQARFVVPPGAYRVEVRFSSGVKRAKVLQVAAAPVKETIDAQTPKVE